MRKKGKRVFSSLFFQKGHKSMNVLQISTTYEVQDKHLPGDQNFPLLTAVSSLGPRETTEAPL